MLGTASKKPVFKRERLDSLSSSSPGCLGSELWPGSAADPAPDALESRAGGSGDAPGTPATLHDRWGRGLAWKQTPAPATSSPPTLLGGSVRAAGR